MKNTDTLDLENKKSFHNLFTDVFGDPWDRKIEIAINSPIDDRFAKMQALDIEIQSSSLHESKKLLMHKLFEAFQEASGITEPKRLIELIDKAPNLKKDMKKKRVSRIYDDIDGITYRFGFGQLAPSYYMPLFFSSMMLTYGYDKAKLGIKCSQQFGIKNYFGVCLSALLARYAKKLSPYDYVSEFFVLSFMKNISYNSIVQKESIKQHPELTEYASNIFLIMDKLIESNLIDTEIKEDETKEENTDITYDDAVVEI